MNLRVPLDKSEGVVKTEDSRAVFFLTAWRPELVENRSSVTHTVNQLAADRSANHRYDLTAAMILLSESRLSPGRERPINPSG
jgi:hypothetical protein